MHIKNLHQNNAILFSNKLIVVQEDFNMTDFPVIDAFHVFYPRNILETVSPTYNIEEAKLVYTFCGNNQVNIFQEQIIEASAVKVNKETFLIQCSQYFQIKKKHEKCFKNKKRPNQASCRLKELENKERTNAKALNFKARN